MIPLHEIRTEIGVWLWGYAAGRAGMLVANGNRLHAYWRERGTPPPIGNHRRTYWTPYHLTYGQASVREYVLNPACGPLRTSSRIPSLQTPPAWYDFRTCLTCATLHPDTRYRQQIVDADPWRGMTTTERIEQLDPISGQ